MGAPIPESADDAALAWFVRLRDEQVTAGDRHAFEAWLHADPRHERAWRELEGIWGALDAVAPDHAPARERPVAMRFRFRLPPLRRLAAAAMVLLGLAAGWQLVPPGLLADHRSGIGERRTVALADGSQVELAPGSALDVAFSGGRRGVRLLAGEAFFTVAKEAGRPFVVEAGAGRVEVLGTAFDVKIRDEGGVAVVVTENIVAVSANGREAVRVGEGEGVSYDGEGVSQPSRADLDLVGAWRQDQLVFHDAPLDAVVAELERYRRGHIQLVGAGLGSRRVTAVFDARNTDAALDTIAHSLGLRVLRATGWFVAIVPW
jgi:transmembrane sensor